MQLAELAQLQVEADHRPAQELAQGLMDAPLSAVAFFHTFQTQVGDPAIIRDLQLDCSAA